MTTERQEQRNDQELLLDATLASAPGNEQQAMEQVAQVVLPLHLVDEQFDSLKTAVAEAVMNAMEHGNHYQPDKVVTLRVLASKSAVIVRIGDQGAGERGQLMPETIATPDLEAKLAGLQTPRGWGLFLIKSLVDELHVSREDQQNILELVMYRHTNNEHNPQPS